MHNIFPPKNQIENNVPRFIQPPFQNHLHESLHSSTFEPITDRNHPTNQSISRPTPNHRVPNIDLAWNVMRVFMHRSTRATHFSSLWNKFLVTESRGKFCVFRIILNTKLWKQRMRKLIFYFVLFRQFISYELDFMVFENEE